MKIILQSNDRFGDFGEFDTEARKLTVHSKNESPEWKSKVNGWFGAVGSRPAILFHIDHNLHFVYWDITVPLGNNAQARVEGGQIKRQFTLEDDGRVLIRIDYEVPAPVVPPELDFTQTHPEDFDFLLFVRNVLGNRERRKLAQGFPRS